MSATIAQATGLTELPGRWKNDSVPVIGLTGEIGAGKSQVAGLLQRRGAVVIDADMVGHLVLEEPDVRCRVIDRFGACVEAHPAGVAGLTGRVDRRALAAIVFADRNALRDLESIVHPRMFARFEELIDRQTQQGKAPAVVLDAAILLEAGWDRLCDVVLHVEAPRSMRLARVYQSRGWSEQVLDAREAAQWPRQRKLDRADVVISNETSLDDLDQDVDCWFWKLIGRPPASQASRDGLAPGR